MSLHEQLTAALKPHADVAGRGGEPNPDTMANVAEAVVTTWLRQQAEVYKDSPDPAEHQIRYELLAMAHQVEVGQA